MTVKSSKQVPNPSPELVEYYLREWDKLEHYRLQEDALDKLFVHLCPENTDISDILLKVSTLNDFYSTNIFNVYPVAQRILSLDIDVRLNDGDPTLVADIQRVTVSNVERNFYSFASKYCSHHNPKDFPIYDSYVDNVLCYFRNLKQLPEFRFKNEDLKDYIKFKEILRAFKSCFGLDKFNLKQIDRYLWQLGKDYFPKKY